LPRSHVVRLPVTHACTVSEALAWVLGEGDWGPFPPDDDVGDPGGYVHTLREFYRQTFPPDATDPPASR
jgi:hypothetical protein